MIKQWGSLDKITKLIDKIYTRHADAFFSFYKATTDMENDLISISISIVKLAKTLYKVILANVTKIWLKKWKSIRM